MVRWSYFILIAAALLAGCQQPVAGQRQPLFDFSRPPRLFNFNSTAENSTTPWSMKPNNANQNSWFANNGNQNQSTWGSWFRPRGTQGAAGDPQQTQLFQGLNEQMQSLSQRLGQFDNDNQQLLTDMAGLKQRLQAANDYNYQLKQQLTDSIAQMQQLQNEKLNMEQQLAAAQMRAAAGGNVLPAGTSGGLPSQLPGGAVLRANNSLLQKMPMIQLPGVTTRMDGDVIRVELPSDQVFAPNSYQITNDFGQVLQQVAGAIRNHFPEQIIGVEAHWDNSPIQPATTTHHQLTASQCLAVFDYLSRIGLPDRQMFTMAMGSNRPRHPAGMVNGISPNRRIEIVIYPESYTGR